MFKKILDKIKPAKKDEYEVLNKVDDFLSKINKKLLNAEAVVGGSFAKGTWLKGNHDIDIFVLFKKETNMSLRLEVVIKSIFDKYEKIHGSRDYFIVNYSGLSFELVPVLKIDMAENAKNITDVSPMHVEWVKKNSNQKIKDEIRIAKYFMKCNSVYGAETYIGGFSGYLVELLVIHYNGFSNLVRNSADWKHPVIVSIEGNNFFSKQKFPLVVTDPVQPNRNAAAALTHEKFDLFAELCKKFIKRNSSSFFKEKKINLKKYNLIFEVYTLEGSMDVVGTKILKVFEKIKYEFEKNGFIILDSGWYWNKSAHLFFKIKNKKLTEKVRHFGPPMNIFKAAENFKDKHRGLKIFELNKRLCVWIPRKFTKAKSLAFALINDKDILKKVKKIEIYKV